MVTHVLEQVELQILEHGGVNSNPVLASGYEAWEKIKIFAFHL